MNLLNEKREVVTTENKAVIKEGPGQFYLRTLGRTFYNPYDLTHRAGLRKTKFIKVPKNVYDLYLKFLESKLVRYKSQAERLL